MPTVRLRRLRRNSSIRNWASQTQLGPKNIILPYFVVAGRGVKEPIKSMPGVYHFSVDQLLKDIAESPQLKSILLFGIPTMKDDSGSEGYKKNGVVQKAIQAVKKMFKHLIVISDVCLCGYSRHGHCGIIRPQATARRLQAKKKSLKPEACSLEPDLIIDNDATLEVLVKIALSHAQAGVDFVAPSAMMDGQVGTIRENLDKNGFKDIGILSYSAKYASNFYGPFREALDSRPQFGDRKNYQMDYRNSDAALREIEQDINEGADIVVVKPALAYLDIIYRAKQKFNIPIAAYNVSGEYAMVKAYCQASGFRLQASGVEKELVLEMLTAIKRAGADFIITYWAKQVYKWLK